MPESDTPFEGWAILELMGHRRLAGSLSEERIAGAPFIRIDVFGSNDETARATQFYAPAAVYCITPTTERAARDLADFSGSPAVVPALSAGFDDDECPF